MSGSLIFSTVLRHHVWISYILGSSSTLCPDPLSFQRLSSIMSRSLLFSTALRHRVWIPYLFGGSLASCPDPLSFWWFSGIAPGSPFIFNGSPTSCPNPLSFQRLSGIVSGSVLFSEALQHRVWIPYCFGDSPASCLDLYLFDSSPTSCLDPLSFQRLSAIVSGSSFFSTVLRHRAWIP